MAQVLKLFGNSATIGQFKIYIIRLLLNKKTMNFLNPFVSCPDLDTKQCMHQVSPLSIATGGKIINQGVQFGQAVKSNLSLGSSVLAV